MLRLKEVSKSYTTGEFTQTALDQVTLSFRKNEFVAILGPSGSGKTTCLNVVGGLDQYDSGDLIINGKSTKHFKDSDWDAYRNNSVGFVFQSYNLISHLNIVDNVEMGMTLSGVSASEKRKKALEVLDQVGLSEHAHKNPNQLSGGQMQRVAIARALANDPDIILADEPTGALDTQTSIQIMELIKEIAKDKLVIMVTHNPELANTYADRIVSFLDGQVMEDSNPYETEDSDSDYTLKKTSMGFLTALKLSGKNIVTKKWRTILTSFASSIGIIGIALVLSLSNGFDKQIDKFEETTLSGFPIMITQQTSEMDMQAMIDRRNEMMGKHKDDGKYPDKPEMYPYDSKENRKIHTNIFTEEYLRYIEKIDPKLLSGISYTRLVNMPMLRSKDGKVSAVNTSELKFSTYPSNMGDRERGYLEKSYDLLAGSFPKEMQDLVLIVDGYNRLDQRIVEALGYDSKAEKISFDDLLGHEFKIIPNDAYYTKAGDSYVPLSMVDTSALDTLYHSDKAITVKIAGILRANEDNKLPVLSEGVAYSDQLSQYFIENARESEIVKAQQAADFNVLTGVEFSPSTESGAGGGATKEKMLSTLGADGTPHMIVLYPMDFQAKDAVLAYLDQWNDDLEVEDTILYTDLAATFSSLSGSIMSAITMVLIAFAAISLVVSMIMIGIITYISVLERTKEIGVLRALGARKKDITRVFNAETFIIGTCSGLLGIGIAYLLTIPVNIILEKLTELSNVAQLNPLHAILLVAISVALTMLGGFIPAKMAAKKDPVIALRTE